MLGFSVQIHLKLAAESATKRLCVLGIVCGGCLCSRICGCVCAEYVDEADDAYTTQIMQVTGRPCRFGDFGGMSGGMRHDVK